MNSNINSSFGFDIREILKDMVTEPDWGAIQYRPADNGWDENITYYGDERLLTSSFLKKDEVLLPEGIGPDGKSLSDSDVYRSQW
jgi:hypothetical protein